MPKRVAPRARGCRLPILTAGAYQRGCPACAGMSHGAPHHGRVHNRLPRVRGDVACHCPSSTDCPACAGMSPLGLPTMLSIERLPRVRGDVSDIMVITIRVFQVAPRARGCLAVESSVCRRKGGCPACAGMSPPSITRPRVIWWLPRVRGDVSCATIYPNRREQVAPRARGCRGSIHGTGAEAPGCPACAGMSPVHYSVEIDCAWLPRVRGDVSFIGRWKLP